MSYPAASPAVADTGASTGPGEGRLSFGGVIASEWIKFFSLRSTYLALAVFIFVTAGFNTILCIGLRLNGDPGSLADDHLSVMVAQLTATAGTLVAGVLGVFSITNEYSSGLIRSTFTAVPRRLPVLAAKTIVLALVGAWASVVSIAVSYIAGWLLLRHTPIDLSPVAGENGRILLGVVLYVVTVTVFGLMVGALIRSTAAAMAVVVAVAFILPLLADQARDLIDLGGSESYPLWRRLILYAIELLPTVAGRPLLSWTDDTVSSRLPSLHLTPWSGLAIMWCWVLLFAVPAVIRWHNRDAG